MRACPSPSATQPKAPEIVLFADLNFHFYVSPCQHARLQQPQPRVRLALRADSENSRIPLTLLTPSEMRQLVGSDPRLVDNFDRIAKIKQTLESKKSMCRRNYRSSLIQKLKEHKEREQPSNKLKKSIKKAKKAARPRPIEDMNWEDLEKRLHVGINDLVVQFNLTQINRHGPRREPLASPPRLDEPFQIVERMSLEFDSHSKNHFIDLTDGFMILKVMDRYKSIQLPINIIEFGTVRVRDGRLKLQMLQMDSLFQTKCQFKQGKFFQTTNRLILIFQDHQSRATLIQCYKAFIHDNRFSLSLQRSMSISSQKEKFLSIRGREHLLYLRPDSLSSGMFIGDFSLDGLLDSNQFPRINFEYYSRESIDSVHLLTATHLLCISRDTDFFVYDFEAKKILLRWSKKWRKKFLVFLRNWVYIPSRRLLVLQYSTLKKFILLSFRLDLESTALSLIQRTKLGIFFPHVKHKSVFTNELLMEFNTSSNCLSIADQHMSNVVVYSVNSDGILQFGRHRTISFRTSDTSDESVFLSGRKIEVGVQSFLCKRYAKKNLLSIHEFVKIS